MGAPALNHDPWVSNRSRGPSVSRHCQHQRWMQPQRCLKQYSGEQEEQRAMGNGSTMHPGSREKPAQPAPKVSSIELALTWASDQRLRLQLLVSCSGTGPAEVEPDMLRTSALHDHHPPHARCSSPACSF